jgi:hypothetical protein
MPHFMRRFLFLGSDIRRQALTHLKKVTFRPGEGFDMLMTSDQQSPCKRAEFS